MRKTAVVLLALATAFTVVGCVDKGRGSVLRPSAAPVESAPPVETAFEPHDSRKDITDVKAVRASAQEFPEGDTVHVSYLITNHGKEAATYVVIFGVYDADQTQVASFGTDSSIYAGPTSPGGKLFYEGDFGMSMGHLPAGPFTVEVQSVERSPEVTD
jgi:hypothetical protein